MKGSSTSCTSGAAPVRYAVRQVLDQEYRKETLRKHSEVLNTSTVNTKTQKSSRKSSSRTENDADSKYKDPLKDVGVKRDFFGRVIQERTPASTDFADGGQPVQNEASKAGRRVWVTYHDGFSNAVRKPISMGELLAGL